MAETLIEPAGATDAAEIAEVFLASRADALPYLPKVHGDDETRDWIANQLVPLCQVWVARHAGRIVGFLALHGDCLEQLYLRPGWYRRGIGSALLAQAKQANPDRLRLFTFQANHRARAFYEKHGFAAVDFNDGARNEEKTPDVLYEWRGA
ncbi:MAG TPA: GNAT family N-acetyltransferase [Caulobacteraceae bacterium]|nr:GNAT family N-acetyltransferase [Caulobacteraceae bacterium]